MTWPKIIHRIWLDEPESAKFAPFLERLEELHPGWEIRTWRDSSELTWLRNQAEFEAALESDPFGRAPDILRYELLWRFGGVYWDTDMEPLRPLDQLLEDPRPFAAWENERTMCTAVLAAPPQHPAIDVLIEGLPANLRRMRSKPPNHASGPEYATALWAGRDDVRRLPPATFYPVGWWERELLGQVTYPPETIAVHHWNMGWGEKAAAPATTEPRTPPVGALDALASRVHYLEHLAPIWEALEPERRGRFWIASHLQGLADELGLDVEVATRFPLRDARTGPVMVAGERDYTQAPKRPIVWVAHGAGQSYSSAHSSYPGGQGRDRTILFVSPSERVAERNRAAYPSIPAVAVGCPRLDPWHEAPPASDPGLVAFAWHFDAAVAPESRSAWTHYKAAVQAYARDHDVIGTAHPRIVNKVRPWYEQVGIEFADWREIFDRAAVLVADTTSLGWEFLSLDRPVVWLNLPSYRRGIEHGLRFWEFADAGVQVDEPAALPDSIALALVDQPQQRARRREVIPELYAATDGKAAERAAEAVMDVLKGAQHG